MPADNWKTLVLAPLVLTEGAVLERLRREFKLRLDPKIGHSVLVYDAEGRRVLGQIYREYLEVGRQYGLPMVISAPTWRASLERVALSGYGSRNVNADCVAFVKSIRDEFGAYGDKVFIGGLVGPRGNAYRPQEALSGVAADAYHQAQLKALAEAGVDFLHAATLPALCEALGIARAVRKCRIPFVISFVLKTGGTLLDGTPLHHAVMEVDAISPRPAFFMVNCAHPVVFAQAFDAAGIDAPMLRSRVIGLQANTSRRNPAELDGAPVLESEDPDTLAEAMIDLHRRFQTKILGGCCGTNARHIEALARRMVALKG